MQTGWSESKCKVFRGSSDRAPLLGSMPNTWMQYESRQVAVGLVQEPSRTIHKGDKAPKAAGVIHSDFEKGFIRAEVISYEDFVTYKTEAAVRAAGKMGIEGKEYVVKDGDVMHFLFNV